MNKLKLPNVTLCCFGSEKYRDQQQKALDYSSKYIEFGAVKNIIVPTNSIDEWNRAVVFDLGDHIDTDFALLIHPDGGVGEPELWREQWLQYDFVGSPFPLPNDNFSYRDINGKIQRVGNSVSLRSKKLMQLPKKIGMEWKPFHGYYNEDGYISVNMRHIFEKHGCKFAPFEEALLFGREMPLPENKGLKTFAYHKTIGENARYPDFEKGNLVVTEMYHGQGLGNQIFCYVATRVIALDKGYDFGIMNPEKFKGKEFFSLDLGKKIIGGKGPEGGPPKKLPDGIFHYYSEKQILHPLNGSDLRLYDKDLVDIFPNTKIDGIMQDEKYFEHRKSEIKEWLKVKKEYECYDYTDDNTCVINFRGGEYARHKDLYLNKKYWEDAVNNMLKINEDLKFIVITDDTYEARKFFPNYDVYHFNIAKDYVIVKNAHYLILSNSSFAWFPAWLSPNLKYCIAPKYWARHNVSDGYWSCGYNITKGWMYQDRDGKLSDYATCIREFEEYKKNHPDYFNTKNNKIKQSNKFNLFLFLKKKIGGLLSLKTKNFISGFISRVRKSLERMKEYTTNKNRLNKEQIKGYRKKIKIYDIFTYNGEADILEIRLNILKDFVDQFIIVEAPTTFSGLNKPLYFEEQKERFKPFLDKIKYFVIDDYPNDRELLELADSSSNVPKNGPEHWRREFYQKESIKKALTDLNDDDICFIGDVDEICNPEVLIDYTKNDIFKLKQIVYAYYLNNRSNELWAGTMVTKYKNIKNSCLNHLRTKGKTKYVYIKNGGWHFTSMGGINEVRRKLNDSYTKDSYNTGEVQGKLDERFGKKDYMGRNFKFWTDEKDLPKYILDNKEKYKNLLR